MTGPRHGPTPPAAAPLRRATTLVEVSISTLLVGVVLVAALNCLGGAVRCVAAGAEGDLGEVYAQEMLAEIAAAAYHDPQAAHANEHWGIEPGEPDPPTNRLAFDDIDDYDGWAESAALTGRDGGARPDTAGWQRSVQVHKVSPSDVATLRSQDSYDQGVRRVGVQVLSPAGKQTHRYRYFGAGGAMEQPPAADTICVTGVRIEIATADASASGAAALLNHASGPPDE